MNEAFGNTLIIIIANSVCKHFSHMEPKSLSHFSFSYITSRFAKRRKLSLNDLFSCTDGTPLLLQLAEVFSFENGLSTIKDTNRIERVPHKCSC